MCDDVLFNIRNRTGNLNLQICEKIYNQALISIDDRGYVLDDVN
jgi:hypothetical protein